jgi:hypothetical protein
MIFSTSLFDESCEAYIIFLVHEHLPSHEAETENDAAAMLAENQDPVH